MFESQPLVLTVATLGTLVLLNAVATFIVAKHGTYPTSRKVAQYIFIWLVPALGAVACILVALTDAVAIRRSKSQEFFESADAGGADH